ncbi:accessory Sec system S-layer assembly protein [Pueribacillus theae]|uniref:Accessory Sec system S-layer assembly protein n=1 Tax=Pueribacillus theae TaxID=2171751 RepID=A0A2U1JL86_9BACI|nr:accessory Sec system S-layer assembly protein [Pueribacillus theae]PWA05765.1 accessory Sec system S-layer assembly protein [Pueribacillus theae]
MFKFSRGSKKQNNKAIPAEDVLTPDMEKGEAGSEEIETALSIPDEWNMTEEDRYVYAFHNSQSPKLKRNQISIYGMELNRNSGNSVTVTGLIRSTVTQNITFGEATILLLGANDKLLARKEFDLSRLGTIPTNSARPWNFEFSERDFVEEMDELPTEWKLAFELKTEHRLDLEPSWEKALDAKAREALEKIVENAPELKENEVNFLGVKADLQENGNLIVTVLIRNGYNRGITLEQVPLGIRDASNEEVARGSFKLNDFTVKANTSKPWTFIFPKEMVKKENLDLSRWTAYPIQ